MREWKAWTFSICFVALVFLAGYADKWGSGPTGSINYAESITASETGHTAGYCISWESATITRSAGDTRCKYVVPIGYQLYVRSFSIILRASMAANGECDFVLRKGLAAAQNAVDSTLATIEVGPESVPLLNVDGHYGSADVNVMLDEGDWFEFGADVGSGGARDTCTTVYSSFMVAGTLTPK